MLRQIAYQFLITHSLRLPVRADLALYAAGFFPVPSSGPASLDGDILRYDESRATWQLEVWNIICARLLEEGGQTDTPEARAELAQWLGVLLDRAPRFIRSL
jgi:hypothetical protein